MRHIATIIILFCAITTQAQILYNPQRLAQIKANLDKEPYRSAYNTLIKEAGWLLNKKPLSVLNKTHTPASGNKHDFMSLNIYSWPDSTKQDRRPYIIRDGYFNPEYKEYDFQNWQTTLERINKLSVAYYFSDDEKFAAKATELIKTWFTDKQTRMTPHFRYCQVIPGTNNEEGHSVGLIDAKEFAQTLNSVLLLEQSSSYDSKTKKAFRKWVKNFVKWIEESEYGKQNATKTDNVGTAYDMQMITYYLFAGDHQKARTIINRFIPTRMESKIESDGAQTQEIRRPTSFIYSWINVGLMADVMIIAKNNGIGIDNEKLKNGATFYSAVDFLVPYLDRKRQWPYQEVGNWNQAMNSAKKELHRIAHSLNSRYLDYLPLLETANMDISNILLY